MLSIWEAVKTPLSYEETQYQRSGVARSRQYLLASCQHDMISIFLSQSIFPVFHHTQHSFPLLRPKDVSLLLTVWYLTVLPQPTIPPLYHEAISYQRAVYRVVLRYVLHIPQCRTMNMITHTHSSFAMALVILRGAKANRTAPTTRYYPIMNFAITISQAVPTSSEGSGNNFPLGTSSSGSSRLARGSTKRSVSETTTNPVASTARVLRSELVSSAPFSSSGSSDCDGTTLSAAGAISTVVATTTSSALAQSIGTMNEVGIRDGKHSGQDAGVQENDAERTGSVGVSTDGGGGSRRGGCAGTLKLQELLEASSMNLSIHTKAKILSFLSSS